jgi:hypothetical protein
MFIITGTSRGDISFARTTTDTLLPFNVLLYKERWRFSNPTLLRFPGGVPDGKWRTLAWKLKGFSMGLSNYEIL